jgi:hypothetical protein
MKALKASIIFIFAVLWCTTLAVANELIINGTLTPTAPWTSPEGVTKVTFTEGSGIKYNGPYPGSSRSGINFRSGTKIVGGEFDGGKAPVGMILNGGCKWSNGVIQGNDSTTAIQLRGTSGHVLDCIVYGGRNAGLSAAGKGWTIERVVAEDFIHHAFTSSGPARSTYYIDCVAQNPRPAERGGDGGNGYRLGAGNVTLINCKTIGTRVGLKIGISTGKLDNPVCVWARNCVWENQTQASLVQVGRATAQFYQCKFTGKGTFWAYGDVRLIMNETEFASRIRVRAKTNFVDIVGCQCSANDLLSADVDTDVVVRVRNTKYNNLIRSGSKPINVDLSSVEE